MQSSAEFQKVGSSSEVLDALEKDKDQAHSRLVQICNESRKVNGEWIEWLFAELRRTNPLVDVLMLSEEGRVEGSWATFLDYPQMKSPPKIDELAAKICEDGRLHYMITSRRDSAIFYFGANQDALLSLMSFEPVPYVQLQTPQGNLAVNMTYLEKTPQNKKNLLSPSSLRRVGLVVGNLGFWPKPNKKAGKPGIGFLTSRAEAKPDIKAFIPRAYVIGHPAGRGFYLSPLGVSELLQEGMLPMDRKSGMKRIQVYPITDNIIFNFLFSYMQDERVRGLPLVLRYSTYRPWLGDFPEHRRQRVN